MPKQQKQLVLLFWHHKEIVEIAHPMKFTVGWKFGNIIDWQQQQRNYYVS